MKLKKLLLLFVAMLSLVSLIQAQGLKSFVLNNGLTVYVWEDPTQSDVFGMVTTRAGSVDDPEQYTGLAHYLEHLMFKGTDRIGALDWAAEKPIYEQIIAKYDERAEETDPARILEIDHEIQQLSIQQNKLSKADEFSSLMQSIGGTNINAGTIYDYTTYFNSFPKEQLDKWLDIFSVRLMNPVFRQFQTELEVVYEEYNRFLDNTNRQVNQFVLEHAFSETPYSRAVLGTGDHLKNPKLSELIKYYETWYVPQNMALILVGDLKTEEIANMVNRRFGRIPQAEQLTQRTNIVPNEIKGRKQISERIGEMPQTLLIYNGVTRGHDDEFALEIALQMLNNRNRTGILDKLAIEGDLMIAYSSLVSLANDGKIIINATPSYDYAQRRFESHRRVERMLTRAVDQLLKGDIEDWLFESVKNNMIRMHMRNTEYSSNKAQLISDAFVNNYDIARVLDYPAIIQSITMDDVLRVAKEYLNNNYIAMHLNEGKKDKTEHIEKPSLPEMPDIVNEEKSIYAQWFEQVPVEAASLKETSFDDVSIEYINDRSRLFYYANPVNDIFTMTLKYGIGEREMPELGMATSLMNNAGVLATFEPQEFRNALSQVNATVSYSVDDDYTYVQVEGTEDQLTLICNLITRQILMPKLDEKQINNVKGQVIQTRRIEKNNADMQQNALIEYMRYHDRSDYIDRKSDREIIDLTISDLTTAFQKATDYAAEVHYVGNLPFETVHEILSANLPLKADELESQSPQVKQRVNYTENTIYFVPNNDVTQSRILFFMEGKDYSPQNAATLDVFNRYFGGSWGSLVNEEIRVKRSMAYTAAAALIPPPLEKEKYRMDGFIGTQADKTIDAIEVFLDLKNNMPQYPERIDVIKNNVSFALMAGQPHFRNVSQNYESMKNRGFSQPAAHYIVPAVQEMTFDDLLSFYEEVVKETPIVIGIVGNPRQVNIAELEKFGKVERINLSRLYKN